MVWHYSPYMLPLMLAAALSAWVAIVAWRRRHVPGATPLFWLMIAALHWSLTYFAELGYATVGPRLIWIGVQYPGIAMISAMWLWFAIEYTGNERWLSRLSISLALVVPFLTIVLQWTNRFHGLVYQSAQVINVGSLYLLEIVYGPWFWIFVFWTYGLTLLGIGLIVDLLMRSRQQYRAQIIPLLVAVLVPVAANVVYVLNAGPLPNLDITPIAFTATGAALAWALFRRGLLDLVPIARDRVVESMEDGIIIVDERNRIVDINPAARVIAGGLSPEVIGMQVDRVFDGWRHLVERFQSVADTHVELSPRRDGVSRYYDVNIQSLRDHRGRHTGRLITVRDTSERRAAEEERRERERFLTILADITHVALEAADSGEMLQGIVERIAELFGADGCVMTVWDDER